MCFHRDLSQSDSLPLIEALLSFCCPTAVTGFVIPARVRESINRMLNRRTPTHILEEIFIAVSPPFANRDSESTVVLPTIY